MKSLGRDFQRLGQTAWGNLRALEKSVCEWICKALRKNLAESWSDRGPIQYGHYS